MGTFYSLQPFRIQLKPGATKEVNLLIEKYDLGQYFEIEDNILECFDLAISCGYDFGEIVEQFLKTDLQEYLADSILLTDEFDGGQSTFAIGPDKEELENEHWSEKIRGLFCSMTPVYQQKLLKELSHNFG